MPTQLERDKATINEYLNALTEEELDRVLTAQDWCGGVALDYQSSRCLVGHAEGYFYDDAGLMRPIELSNLERLVRFSASPAFAFDRLIMASSLPEAVSYVKSLAVRIAAEKFPLRVPAPAPVEQIEEVGA